MGRKPAMPAAGLWPPGYHLRTWREGDQKNWARIQKEAGEFGDMTLSQAEGWFLQEYGERKEELSFRCLFAESMDGEADGVCMAWTEEGIRILEQYLRVDPRLCR